MEHWFTKCSINNVTANGRRATSVWNECLMKHRVGSLPSAVTAGLSSLDSADAELVSSNSDQHEIVMESKARQGDDIDALLSAAGTFVSDQKTQLKQKNVDIMSQSQQESSVNVTSDASVLAASTTYSGPHHAAAAFSESLSCYVITNSCDSTGRSRAVLH